MNSVRWCRSDDPKLKRHRLWRAAIISCSIWLSGLTAFAGPAAANEISGEAEYRAALKLIADEQPALAVPLLWKAASLYHEAALWITMGYCYFLLDSPEKSFAAYGVALHYDPGNEEVLKWFADSQRDVQSGVIAVNWRPSREAVLGYNLYLQLFQNGPYFRVNNEPIAKAPFLVSGLRKEREYKVRLSAISDEAVPAEGELSPAETVFSFHGKLRKRHSTRYKILKGGRLELEWVKSQDPWLIGYNIYLQLPGGRRLERVNHSGVIKNNKYMLKGLAFGVTYLVRIVAVVGDPQKEKTIEEISVSVPIP
jgi:tetratricopeptide (TPR) repeat protein